MACCRREYLSWVVLFLAAASALQPCSAQAPAPTPGTDCTTYITALYPCLDYILGTNSTPSTGCCTGLAQIASASPLCLCEIVSSVNSSSINVTHALLLPSLCNVTTPPLSSCPASSPGSPLSATAPVSSSLPPSTAPALAPTPSTASSPGSPLSAIAPASSSLPPSTTPALAPTPSTVPSPGSSMPVSAPSPMLSSPAPSVSPTTPILGPSPSMTAPLPSTMPENGPSPMQPETPTMPPNAPSPTQAEPGSPPDEAPTPSSPTVSSPPPPPVPTSAPPVNSVGCSASPNTVYVILSMSFVAWKLMMQ